MHASSVIEGLYTPMAYINGGGMCLKWLRDDVLSKSKSFRELDIMAEEVPPGSEGLVFLPHFSGRVCPNDALLRGSYINLSWMHKTAHLYRAIMEGISYEYSIYADIIRELVPSLAFEQVIGVGGGSKSQVFNQIKADVLGVPISTIALSDTASLACCAIAGYGVGLYGSPTDLVKKTMRIKSTVQPDQSHHELYRPFTQAYAKSLYSLHNLYDNLQALG